MSLIKCPICEKEISPNAIFCPNCGEPMKNKETDKIHECPSLPDNLDIGKQIVNWTYDAAIKGIYDSSGIGDELKPGKVSILLHERGIQIVGRLYQPLLKLHNAQIVNLDEISKSELANKSVIGRAVLGGVLTGGLGAIIGGMSGIGSKNIRKYYLIINYWDIRTRELKTLSIGCNDSCRRFINRFNKQKGI